MRRRELAIYAGALLLSLLGHVLVFEGLGRAARQAPPPEARTIEIAVVEPPPPAVEPPPEEPPPPPPPPKPKRVDLTRAKPPPPEAPPPPNVTEPEAAPAEEVRPVFGISMQSTVGPNAGSSFSVRVGNTLMKDPDEEVTPPDEVRAYKPVPLHQVNKMPQKLSECRPRGVDESELRNIEGEVKLEVEVREDGTVGEVLVVRGIDARANRIAVTALKQCHFSPAELAGRPVATRIPYTYRFELRD